MLPIVLLVLEAKTNSKVNYLNVHVRIQARGKPRPRLWRNLEWILRNYKCLCSRLLMLYLPNSNPTYTNLPTGDRMSQPHLLCFQVPMTALMYSSWAHFVSLRTRAYTVLFWFGLGCDQWPHGQKFNFDQPGSSWDVGYPKDSGDISTLLTSSEFYFLSTFNCHSQPTSCFNQ